MPIIPTLDPREDRPACLGSSLEVISIQHFAFKSRDHLFDKGFISFEGDGELIFSPVADRTSLHRMGVLVDQRVTVGAFSEGQRRFLDYHRDNILQLWRRPRG